MCVRTFHPAILTKHYLMMDYRKLEGNLYQMSVFKEVYLRIYSRLLVLKCFFVRLDCDFSINDEFLQPHWKLQIIYIHFFIR